MKKETKDMGVNSRKGMPSKDHWEMSVAGSSFPKPDFEGPDSAWIAKPPSTRPTPHHKVNECDH